MFGIGQVAGIGPREVRHLILGDIGPQRLGVRCAIAEHQQHFVLFHKFFIRRHRSRRLETVLDAHQFDFLAVDPALFVDILHSVDATLRNILPLIGGGSSKVHEVPEFEGGLCVGNRARHSKTSDNKHEEIHK